ncbi:MAG: hydrogenase formation protein HypD [Desulfomonilaceae bacterium]
MKINIEQKAAQKLASDINFMLSEHAGSVKFMEVCGTHTMAIHSSGIKSLFTKKLLLVSGPGCPVCVTEKLFIDQAIFLGAEHRACIATFGDLIRVPGSEGSLADLRSKGGLVRVVYSPMDTIKIAVDMAPKPVIFLGVGFETTIPTVAATLKAAKAKNIRNLFVLPAFKTIHRPLKILASQPGLTGFILPGHVSAIIGADSYRYLVEDYHKPGVVTGFDALDILVAIRSLVQMALNKEARIENKYKTVVKPKGNAVATALINEVFEPAEAKWRGLGLIPDSGLSLKTPYETFDAYKQFRIQVDPAADDARCKCARILTGELTPYQCGLFGKECVPETPVGPCMVSSEGTCAAYYKYGGSPFE